MPGVTGYEIAGFLLGSPGVDVRCWSGLEAKGFRV